MRVRLSFRVRIIVCIYSTQDFCVGVETLCLPCPIVEILEWDHALDCWQNCNSRLRELNGRREPHEVFSLRESKDFDHPSGRWLGFAHWLELSLKSSF